MMRKEQPIIPGCAAKAWNDMKTIVRAPGAPRVVDMRRRGLPHGCGLTSFADRYKLPPTGTRTPTGFLDEVRSEVRDVTEAKTFRASETLRVAPMLSIIAPSKGSTEAVPAAARQMIVFRSLPSQLSR